METLTKESESLEMVCVFVCMYFFECVEERRRRRWFRSNNGDSRKHGSNIKGRLGLRNSV